MDRGRKRTDASGDLPADKRPCPSSLPQDPPPGESEPASTNDVHDTDHNTTSSSSSAEHPAGTSLGSHGLLSGEEDDEDADVSDDDGHEDYSLHTRGGGNNRRQKFDKIVETLANATGPAEEIDALSELCEALAFCMDDDASAAYFPAEKAAPVLVRIAAGDASIGNPEAMLFSVRAIAYLCDSMPRYIDAMIRHGALPVLCGRLTSIEYLDVAEQCLQALDKISKKQPVPCLQAGMISAALSYIDFFVNSIQRVALSAVANMCKKIPKEYFSVVMESVPTLFNLLRYEDAKLVEIVATCLISIVDSFTGSQELLDEFCQQEMLEKILHLISVERVMSLSHTTNMSLIRLLNKLASSSVVAVRALFELNVGSTVKGILMASDFSHGMPFLPAEGCRYNQVHEILKLMNELIPPAANVVEDVQVEAKEKIIRDQPNYLYQFSKEIIPVFIKAFKYGANVYICYGCVSILNNIIYFTAPGMLVDLLEDINISSILAGLLVHKDHHVLFSTLRIVEILMKKLPEIFLSSFVKEGLFNALETLLAKDNCSISTSQQSGDLQQLEIPRTKVASVAKCLCYAFPSHQPGNSETELCKLGSDKLYSFARLVKTTYFTNEAVNSEVNMTEILQKLKTCCAILNGNTEEPSCIPGTCQDEGYLTDILVELMTKICGGESMTTFEFLESGLVRSLINYLTNGAFVQKRPDSDLSSHYFAIQKRLMSFAHILFSNMDQGWEKMLFTSLVRKMQNAFTSLDSFPVIMSSTKPRNNITDIPVRRSTMNPCIKVCFKKEKDELSLSSFEGALRVDILSSFDVVENYLWPKVTTDLDIGKANIESEGDSVKQISEDCRQQEININIPKESTSKEKKHFTQPKLVFSFKGQEFDPSFTIYQAILQNYMNAGSDVILSSTFWSEEYEITYRCAGNPDMKSQNLKSDLLVPSCCDKSEFSLNSLPFFSNLLSAELPCKFNKSNASYYILFLLKVLHELNQYYCHLISFERSIAFAEGRIANIEDLMVTVSSVPHNEFVSPKLTDKLEQQMRDVLVSSACGIPSWWCELMALCPFLFTFDAKWKYFCLTSFGSLRVLQNQNRPHRSHDNSSSDRKRKKFKANRLNILTSASKMMKLYSQSIVPLEVEFNEEVGTGLGPTLEFYTLVSHEFQKYGLGIWRGDLCSNCETSEADNHSKPLLSTSGLFPRPWSESTSIICGVPFTDVVLKFALLGQIVAKAIKDGRILDLPLSDAFYKVILGKELSIYDIQSFDFNLGKTLLELQALAKRRRFQQSISGNIDQGTSGLCYHGCGVDDLGLDFTLPGYIDYVLSPEGSKRMVNIENLEEYIFLVVEATVRNGISRQIEAFKSGFNMVFPLKALQVFSETELEQLICGELDPWKYSELVEHIKFDHGYTSSSPPVLNLLEIIHHFGCEHQRAFLQFVTGSPRLPVGGLATLDPKLTVVRKHSTTDPDVELPSVMTCANYLKLPPYSSKEIMTEKLIYAITEGQGSFHLS